MAVILFRQPILTAEAQSLNRFSLPLILSLVNTTEMERLFLLPVWGWLVALWDVGILVWTWSGHYWPYLQVFRTVSCEMGRETRWADLWRHDSSEGVRLCIWHLFRMEEKNNKTVRLSPFLAIEEVISKFDDEKQKEFFNDLKLKDPELYYKYLEWKVTN